MSCCNTSRNWVFRTQEIRQYKINEDPAGEGVAIAEAFELEQTNSEELCA
jgi:hypothetical protein